jgi:hypothetical protein
VIIHRLVAHVTGHDVVQLVTAQVAGAEDRMERVYQWQFDRLMAVVRATAVISASIVATPATALFGESVRTERWLVIALVVGLSAAAGIGILSYVRLGRIRREYLDNLSMLGVTRQRTQTRA